MPTISSDSGEPQLLPGTRVVAQSPHREAATTVTRDTSLFIQGDNAIASNKGKLVSIPIDRASQESEDGATVATIKAVVQGFLDQLSYRSPQTPQNVDMRRDIAAEIVSWNDGLDPSFVKGLTDTSCTIAETAYKHTNYEHQFIAALYTAYLTYSDDIGQHNVEVLGEYVQRFTRGQAQSMVAFERLTTLLGTLHEFYPRISADAIIANSLDSFTAMYIELVTKDVPIHPSADRYPFYLRLKAGIASAYAHLNFTKSWGDATGNFYLQVLPELELITVGINDILSFYKETLAGETDNYVHLRAAAERKPPLKVFKELVDENVESIRKIEKLAVCQEGLAEICHSYIMGYIEFHLVARRYRLEEVVDVTRYLSA
ncbi:terpenoid synthase [Lentinus tigrinus ALCF2SS1-6]|uniref:Terpenoid synthase n=1 Tax=Lentinus tigrinus ALCF2SS1-6 TaxID=1328759 RepID=A0A5C2SGB5_9APHY|nr:terpenoid synthase [Lentinus tigrinus ALCF2SS1-6]